MGLTSKQASKLRQKITTSEKISSSTLDGTTTTETITLGIVAQKITVQSTGDLAGNISVSANGVDFVAAGSFTDGALLTYSTHLCIAIKIDRTGGSGKLAILAV